MGKGEEIGVLVGIYRDHDREQQERVGSERVERRDVAIDQCSSFVIGEVGLVVRSTSVS